MNEDEYKDLPAGSEVSCGNLEPHEPHDVMPALRTGVAIKVFRCVGNNVVDDRLQGSLTVGIKDLTVDCDNLEPDVFYAQLVDELHDPASVDWGECVNEASAGGDIDKLVYKHMPGDWASGWDTAKPNKKLEHTDESREFLRSVSRHLEEAKADLVAQQEAWREQLVVTEKQHAAFVGLRFVGPRKDDDAQVPHAECAPAD